MTLRTRIAAAAALAVAVAVIVVAIAVYLAVRGELRDEVDVSLHERADSVARFVHRPGRPDRLPKVPREPFGGPEGYVQLVLPDGRLLRGSSGGDALPLDQRARAIARTGSGEELVDTTVDGLHLRVLTRGLGGAGAIQVARPLDEVDRQLDRILLVLLFVGAAGVALGAGLGAVVARTALAPIARFTRRTEELAADPDPSERMELTGRDELTRLARSFNTTLDALERSVEAQRHLVADASHELRTPIASLRANIQTLEDADRLPELERAALRADIVEELDELTALVADIVELARGTKAGELADDVRLDQIVEQVAERAGVRVGDHVGFRVSAEPTVVRGEPQRIQRAVANLIDNAVKWSPPGGTVELDLTGGELTVRDHGPGFAEADLPRVFERFYRAEAARGLPGSGLGLAIVRQAAEAHGGFAIAGNAPDGGALLRVSFGAPARASSQPALN
ncbi:MAG: two-component system, OmpR family, sensor histidine kinase MprB [Thermoleophilaceae bacterium]|jgi:two-component system sensor histidine kinase MprB|nr:two-component system, OmpR family, sensor histidine kinase MprB [Thermoleophilaceae bacterium]